MCACTYAHACGHVGMYVCVCVEGFLSELVPKMKSSFTLAFRIHKSQTSSLGEVL